MKKKKLNLYSAVGMKCCHIAYHENHEGIFLVCGRQLAQWRGDDGKPLCKTCKRAARKPLNDQALRSAPPADVERKKESGI